MDSTAAYVFAIGDVRLLSYWLSCDRSGDWIMMPPYKGSERNLTGNELGNLGEYGLFNVKADRTQYQNMAAQQPELLDSLKQNFFAEVDGYYRSEVEEEPLK